MAINLVQSTTRVEVDASSATTFDLTIPDTVAGNALTVFHSIFDNNTTWTIDSVGDAGNAWTTREATATRTQRVRAALSWAVNITGGTRTVTITLAGTAAGGNRYMNYGGLEWSGVKTSAAEDAWDENSEINITSVDASAGPITTTHAGALLVGVAAVTVNDATLNFGSPPSWTNSYRQSDNNNHQGIDAGYWLPGSVQTNYTAQWEHDNANHDGAGVIVALLPEPAAAGGWGGLLGAQRNRLVQI